jgi:hypothetical protein
MYSRREFTKTALAGVAVSLLPGLTRHAAAIDSTVRGVRMGLITGSLNPLPENTGRDPIDVIIEQCLALGAAHIELVTVFPQGAPQIVNGPVRPAARSTNARIHQVATGATGMAGGAAAGSLP